MSKRILVVEDQEDNRQILRDLLGSVGYEMTEAWDGEASHGRKVWIFRIDEDGDRFSVRNNG